MIQLKQNKQSKTEIYNIYIDDSSYALGWAYRINSDELDSYHYSVSGWHNCRVLARQTIDAFESQSVITLNNLFNWLRRGHSVIIANYIDEQNRSEALNITFYFSPNLALWNEDYSFAEYFEKIESSIYLNNEFNYLIKLEDEPSLRIEYNIKNTQSSIEEIILPLEEKIKNAHDEAIRIFEKRFNSNEVQNIFQFPEEIKISCEQYLLYFAQFLQDLGINATSNLKEEAGKVLFSVTPNDDVEALDKIREALAVYLNLPSSPIVYDDSFAAMRLQQQIENLQHSQRMAVRELQFNEKLLIAQSEMIQEKNVTISQQHSVIEQKDKIIEKLSSKSIMIDSAENKEELEKIYEGIEVGESKFLKEKLGIKLNPAKVIKTVVRNTFGKGDEIIELGLNKVE